MTTKNFVPKTYGDCILYNKYPAYNKILMDGILSSFIDKGVDEIYYWGNTISENPPEEYGESIDCK